MPKEIFTNDWEDSLLLQFLRPDPEKETAYICSPLRAEDTHSICVTCMQLGLICFMQKSIWDILAGLPTPIFLCCSAMKMQMREILHCGSEWN